MTPTPSHFAIATRDELWSHGRLLESRLLHGEAIEDERGIAASDVRDDALVEACEREIDRLRAAMPQDARVRLVAEARSDEGLSSTMTVRIGALSVVTTPDHVANDYALLRQMKPGAAPPSRRLPILWRNGSASILLHEAAGHAAEEGHPELEWPSWLSVDLGLRLRRATFRDVPLQRMTNLVARQHGAPFDLPDDRIEIHLLGGGAYEPLTGTVTLHVAAADLIERGQTTPLAPFTLVETRAAIAHSLAGATGDPIRYPGVVCSREGQELVVPSSAPLMLTVFA